MTFLEAFFIAVMEGLTEFLPVSSTGHMMITTALLGIKVTPFIKLFTICIQLGAILSVVVIYFKRFFKSVDFYLKLIIAFIPAAIAGILLGDYIDAALENVFGVALALFFGGIVLIFVDKWFVSNDLDTEEDITRAKAFKIGLFQCIALFPGISRSGATILGGITQKLTRRNAAEFSFFLAVPTMFAATAKKMLDFFEEGLVLDAHDISILAFGNIVAFIVAIIAIKFFINMLTKYGFKGFGWYRIGIGGLLILLYILKIPLSVV